MQHINSNNLDNPRQSAYKSGHSTETALLHIKNEIHLSLSRGEPTALVLLDLLGAFDTVDHTTLLNCLKSWFGYCNSLFKSLSSLNMRKLQCIQNILARIVTNCNKYTRASPILKRLHWLPDEFRCIFKTATLVYKFLHNGHPSYFGPLLSTRCGRYSTRYNHPDKRFLEVPQFCPSVHKSKNHFGHSFAFDPLRFGIICLMRSVLPQLSPVSGKR